MNEKIFSHFIAENIFCIIIYISAEGTQPSWTITEIPGGGEYDKHSLEWKFLGGGGSKKFPPWWGYGSQVEYTCL